MTTQRNARRHSRTASATTNHPDALLPCLFSLLAAISLGVLAHAAAPALAAPSQMAAAPLIIYDDALRNGFQSESYPNGGGIELANPEPTQSGDHSIAFDGLNYGAIALRRASGTIASADYPTLRLWLHGGDAGGQILRLWLIDTSAGGASSHRSLNELIPGGAPVAGTWLRIDVPLDQGALAARPDFDRIEIQSDTGQAQPRLFLDEIALLPAAAVDPIFADGFEPEPALLFVPQYGPGSLRIFEQAVNTWSPVREVHLGAGVAPNALAFDVDGRLWVLDNGWLRSLRRYTRDSLLNDELPQPEAVIGPLPVGDAGNPAHVFDLAVHGDSLYLTRGFGGVSPAVLRYALSDIEQSGNPAPGAVLASPSFNVPAGLAFDANGRLWVSDYGNDSLIRMTTGGSVEWLANNTPVGATRNALNRPEGLAFDAEGALWVGNNGEPTITVYGADQLAATGVGAPAPLQQIDITPGLFQGDTVGGLAFDQQGSLWANYQKTAEVLGYALSTQPGGGYAVQALPPIVNGSSQPGFGGLAIWPPPPTLHRDECAVGTPVREQTSP